MNEDIKLVNSERTKCEVWTRVMGYHRPMQSYNIGKKQEFKDRKYFKEPSLNGLAPAKTGCTCRGK